MVDLVVGAHCQPAHTKAEDSARIAKIRTTNTDGAIFRNAQRYGQMEQSMSDKVILYIHML